MSFDKDSFFLQQSEPNKSCLLALRLIILAQDSQVSETVKYSMPCFVYKNKAFCYLWIDKKRQEPYLLMVEGKQLVHPELEQGTRSRMKILRINPNGDLAIETIKEVLIEALDLLK